MIQKFLRQTYQSGFRQGRRPRLLSVSFVPVQFNKEHPRILHRHEDAFELLLITSGEGVYYLDTAYYPIKKGDLVFCNSGVLHDELAEKNVDLSFYGLRVTGFVFRDLPENHLIGSQACPVVSTGEHYHTLEALFRELYRYADGECHMAEFCEHLMMAIITLSVSCAEEGVSLETAGMETVSAAGSVGVTGAGIAREKERIAGKERICQIKQYIDQNYREDLSLEYLGEIFHLSPYYLSHIFKKAFEIPPMQYLYRRRIGEAQSLLTTTPYSVTEVAGRVGFGDPNYFTVQFRKYVGMPPSAYRNIYARSGSDTQSDK